MRSYCIAGTREDGASHGEAEGVKKFTKRFRRHQFDRKIAVKVHHLSSLPAGAVKEYLVPKRARSQDC